MSFQLPPSTPTKQSSPSGKTRTTRSSVKSALDQEFNRHEMPQNDSAYDKYPILKSMVDEIVMTPRPASAVKERSAKKFRHHLQTYKNSNEDTFLDAIMPLVFKDSFTAKDSFNVAAPPQGAPTPPASVPSIPTPLTSVPSDGAEDREEVVTQICEDDQGEWWDQGQKFTVNQLFADDMSPNAYLAHGVSEKLARRLAKEKGMTMPKPDRVWGIDREITPASKSLHLSDTATKALEIVPTLYNPYLLLEGKSNRGNHAMAEDQARRGGATLVNCALILQDIAREPPETTSAAADQVNVEGQVSSSGGVPGGGKAAPDLNAIVFSATLHPMGIQFWVHWAERFPDKTRFHMNWVAGKLLMDPEAQGAIRTWSQNIHNWGCITRRQYLHDLHDGLDRYGQNQMRGIKRKATGEEEEE